MSQQTTEEAGTIKSRLSDSKRAGKQLFLWMLCHPVFLVFYFLFCRTAYKLCMYGGVRRRGSILLGCTVFFVFYLIQYGYRCRQIHVKEAQEPDLGNVWFYGFHKNGVYLFDKKHGYYEKTLSKEERDFVKMKYKKIPMYRYHFWKVPACMFLLIVTFMTCFGIYKSSQNYNGKLSWVIDDIRTTKYISLDHDNVYESGILGIFEDIEDQVSLPENLTLNGAFNLHFSTEGRILSFDMMLKGYDQNYKFVDTYLISYPSSIGKRIRVQEGNIVSKQEYDEAKSIDSLIVGGMLLPYQEAISEWKEDEYGIYYLGSRTWGKWDANILSLNVDGSVSAIDWDDGNEVTGYSISVFCPDNPEMEPKRYMVGYETIVAEAENADKIEETNLQDAYGTESESLEDMELDDESDSIEKVNKYRIPEQSFDITLDDWGDVTFVSCEPSTYVNFEDASFYLVKDNQVLYKFPYRFEDNSSRGYIGLFDSVGAVAFRDINDDEKKDIIIITYYISGAGPTGMIPRPGVTIYLAGENEFYLAEDMIADVEEHIEEKDRIIENICNFLQQKMKR